MMNQAAFFSFNLQLPVRVCNSEGLSLSAQFVKLHHDGIPSPRGHPCSFSGPVSAMTFID